jgi:glycosyltransferase involved in cell wall biosynthesis
VSVLVCTSGRGDSIVETVRSILLPESACCELIIIDQSDDDRTQDALVPFRQDTRLRYIRSNTKGKGVALNLGMQEARGDIVAITDDDCKVEPDWLNAHVAIYEKFPRVAVTYGNVIAEEYDSLEGYIPAYVVAQETHCTNLKQKLRARGIGANMAVRREVIQAVGGFDPELGPGGRFFACVDGDITVRCLLFGWELYETPHSTVLHYGFRTWEQSRPLTHRAFIGIGAAYIKPLRCGRREVIRLLLYEFIHYALMPSIVATVTFKKPTNWQRVFSFLRGVRQGWKSPIDCATMRYIATSSNLTATPLDQP